MIKVAINGFGRIGRLAFREIMKSKKLEVVAINDLSAPSMLAYLLKYDSTQGTFKAIVGHTENALIVDNKSIAVYAERTPQNLPWSKHKIDLV
jgi:glyceraldehyde 3-phosphate dehydrogenase